MDDAHDVKLGVTNGSVFAYVADGKNGLRVLQVISANDTPGPMVSVPEEQRMYLRGGRVFAVRDEPPGRPSEPRKAAGN
jgi:hypothetical protein